MAKQGADAASVVLDRERGWIEHLPERLQPYAVLARWDRPIGSWLLLLPGWWALAAVVGIGIPQRSRTARSSRVPSSSSASTPPAPATPSTTTWP